MSAPGPRRCRAVRLAAVALCVVTGLFGCALDPNDKDLLDVRERTFEQIEAEARAMLETAVGGPQRAADLGMRPRPATDGRHDSGWDNCRKNSWSGTSNDTKRESREFISKALTQEEITREIAAVEANLRAAGYLIMPANQSKILDNPYETIPVFGRKGTDERKDLNVWAKPETTFSAVRTTTKLVDDVLSVWVSPACYRPKD